MYDENVVYITPEDDVNALTSVGDEVYTAYVPSNIVISD